MSNQNCTLLCFFLADRRFAIPLTNVESVIRAVAVSSVPDANEFFHGVFDFHGEIMPVLNLRKRFGLPSKPIEINDRFIIVSSNVGMFAMVVDEVEEIRKPPEEDISCVDVSLSSPDRSNDLKKLPFLSNEDGVIAIYDVKILLNSEIELQLKQIFETQNKASI
ncbi:MAG: hypothetical protein A2W85_07675 [Bacteroidetes bacterium GWF2_41_31]|nr:MAG: hypothetical protein A2W85_07675 [Bacteroidetes bacterium GWF2_41_31]OFZ10105.1 MAG: hypothetical protein A2338_08180 [Bacteroidetes bacterium RIFOXYB12_FULL_41_6]